MKFLFITLFVIIIGWSLVILFYKIIRSILLGNESNYFSSSCTVCPLRFFGCDMVDDNKVALFHIEQHPEYNYKFKVKSIQNDNENYYLIQVSLYGFSRYLNDKYYSIDECETVISRLVNDHIEYMKNKLSANEKNLEFRIAADKFNKKLERLNN